MVSDRSGRRPRRGETARRRSESESTPVRLRRSTDHSRRGSAGAQTVSLPPYGATVLEGRRCRSRTGLLRRPPPPGSPVPDPRRRPTRNHLVAPPERSASVPTDRTSGDRRRSRTAPCVPVNTAAAWGSQATTPATGTPRVAAHLAGPIGLVTDQQQAGIHSRVAQRRHTMGCWSKLIQAGTRQHHQRSRPKKRTNRRETRRQPATVDNDVNRVWAADQAARPPTRSRTTTCASSAEAGPTSTRTPPGSCCACSQTTSSSSWCRATAASDDNPGYRPARNGPRSPHRTDPLPPTGSGDAQAT